MKRSGQSRFPHRRHISALFATLALLAAVHAAPVFAQNQTSGTVGIETSPQLFATMCALDAAGFDANSSSLDIYPADAALRARLLKMQGPATNALRTFYTQHQFADSEETLSPFLAFSLVVGPPPRFRFIVSHDELPPAVLTIEGFNEILSNFYAESRLAEQWATVETEANHEIARLTDPMRQMVFQTTGYLREIMQPSGNRTFTVLVEPLVGNRVYFRNVGDHYAIIVGPGPALPLGDIRHAFLHFLLDPMTLRYQQTISTKRELLNVAARAPQLPPLYQSDFVGLFDECLVRAVELRMRKMSPEQLETALSANDRTGFILVRPIYQQLILFEKSEPAMSYYFPQLAEGIDVSAENKRFDNFKYVGPSETVDAGGIQGEDATTVGEAELNRALIRGDRQIAVQDAEGAAETFQAILKQHPDLPRAVYGLALASVLQRQGDKAEELFRQLVSAEKGPPKGGLEPSPDILAWSHVYLGRIQDLKGNRERAIHEYRDALAVQEAPATARIAAQQGLDAPYHPATNGQGQ